MKPITAAAVALLLASCGGGEPTIIDGSTPETFRTTLAEARSELGPTDRAKFEAALTLLRSERFASATDREGYSREVRRALDGKQAQEVIAAAGDKTVRASGRAADAVFALKRKLQGG